MPPGPEDIAREQIDRMLAQAGRIPLEYNPAIPIETFDIIVTDECQRSIYNLWRQVLEYFDASIIGLTATQNKQIFGFFHKNLVMEYGHEQAVDDGMNVNYDVFRIKTAITEGVGKVEAGFRRQALPQSAFRPVFQSIHQLDLKIKNLRKSRDLLLPKLTCEKIDVERINA